LQNWSFDSASKITHRGEEEVARRKRKGYFDRIEGAPESLTVVVKRRVKFQEADVMGVAYYGRYADYFEEGSADLGRRCGLSYKDFYEAGIQAPVVQFHVDYHQPLLLDEEFTITASVIWNEASRLNIEYEIRKQDRSLAASGYRIQMFVNVEDGEICLTSPEILENFRRRWKAGEFQWHP
jgi:acyl-CoA thioester hydrolase